MEQEKKSILSLSKEELSDFLVKNLRVDSYRVDQIWDWIYKKRVTSFDEMSSISKSLKENLSLEFSFFIPSLIEKRVSTDGSIKLLLEYQHTGVECVVMPFPDRVSLCVSTQIGCAVGCSFCYTATMGFKKNLDYTEILTQFLVANKISQAEFKRGISHVVFMGMGEPFLNYSNTIKALEKLSSKDYYDLSTRSITVSTSGICDRIISFATDSKCGLAVSLGSAIDEKRTLLMPINKNYGLERLKEALIQYQKISSKIITIEYILIKDINTSPKDIKALVKFLTYLRVKVNLIPLNASPNPEFYPPSEEQIQFVHEHLVSKRIAAPIRYSRASDILGACGQLKTSIDRL